MFTNLTNLTRTVVGTVGMTVCAGLCLVGATAPANAAPVRSATVSYADLDVRTAQGRALLERRVTGAARAVCTSANVGPAARVEEGRCIKSAVSAVKPVA